LAGAVHAGFRKAAFWFSLLLTVSCRRGSIRVDVGAEATVDAGAVSDALAAPVSEPEGGLLANTVGSRRDGVPGIEEMRGLYALAAVPSPARWSAAAADADASRDDDLSTAWRCEPSAQARCGLELRFDQQTEVRMLRVFTQPAAPDRRRRFDARTHPVKIHVDTGVVAASLSDTQRYQHVVLEPPVRTAALVLEISSVDPVTVAEIEVFGPSGKMREPLRVDPRRVIVRGGDALFPSAHGETGYEATPTWVELLDEPSGSHPVLVGSRLELKQGDRLALLREVGGASCPGAQYEEFGETLVVDLETRVIGRLLGEVGAQAFRSTNGRGVAVLSSPDGYQTCRYDSVACSPSGYVKRGGVIGCDNAGPALLGPRGMRAYEPAVPKGCRAATDGEIAHATTPGELAGAYVSCDGREGFRVLVDSGFCSDGSKVVVLDSALRVVWRASNDVSMAQAKRLEDGRLILSVDKGNTGEIDVLEGGRLRKLFPNATFSLPPASGCRCSA
jgi:hypothetical protein